MTHITQWYADFVSSGNELLCCMLFAAGLGLGWGVALIRSIRDVD